MEIEVKYNPQTRQLQYDGVPGQHVFCYCIEFNNKYDKRPIKFLEPTTAILSDDLRDVYDEKGKTILRPSTGIFIKVYATLESCAKSFYEELVSTEKKILDAKTKSDQNYTVQINRVSNCKIKIFKSFPEAII